MSKRDLFEELNIIRRKNIKTALDTDISKIKSMVDYKLKTDSSCAERKETVMKSKKRFTIAAIAATFILGISVLASSGIISTWYSSSRSDPEYKTLPTEEQCIEDIGYAPVLIDEFENGYAFKNGSIVNNDLRDENDNSVEKFKSVTFRYEKEGDKVIFSQEKFNSQAPSEGEVITTIDSVDIYYHSYMNKCVPAGYKMTEEDKKAQESGELVFSEGSQKEYIQKVQSVQWVENGRHYLLLQMDGKLTAQELADMAGEIIAK